MESLGAYQDLSEHHLKSVIFIYDALSTVMMQHPAELKTAKHYYQQIIAIQDKQTNYITTFQIKAYNSLGDISSTNHKTQDALTYYTKGFKLHTHNHEPHILSYAQLTQEYYNYGGYYSTIKFAEKILNTTTTATKEQIFALNIIASSYERLGRIPKAKEYILKAIALSKSDIPTLEAIQDVKIMTSIRELHNNAHIIFLRNHEIQEADQYLDTVLDLEKKLNEYSTTLPQQIHELSNSLEKNHKTLTEKQDSLKTEKVTLDLIQASYRKTMNSLKTTEKEFSRIQKYQNDSQHTSKIKSDEIHKLQDKIALIQSSISFKKDDLSNQMTLLTETTAHKKKILHSIQELEKTLHLLQAEFDAIKQSLPTSDQTSSLLSKIHDECPML
jgi:tetratricopeptide (TPR) repeat protein